MNKIIGGHALKVQRFEDFDAEQAGGLRKCHILFISYSLKDKVSDILATLKGANVLTVSEVENFLVQGGILLFDQEGRKIALQINTEAAKKGRADHQFPAFTGFQNLQVNRSDAMNIMNYFKDMPIRRKTILITMIAGAISLSVACLFFVVNEYRTFPKVMSQNLGNMAQILGDNSTAALAFNDSKTAQDLLGTLKANPHILCAYIYDAKGELFAAYRSSRVESNASAPPSQMEGFSSAGDGLKLFHEIKSGGDKVGTVYLESDMGEMHNRIGSYFWLSLLVLALSSGISFLIASYLQKYLSDPLYLVVNRMQDIARGEGDLTKRLEIPGKDEMGKIAEAFNLFGDKMQKLVRSIAGTGQSIITSSGQLTETSSVMSAATQETSSQANAVSAGARQVSQNLQVVSTATQGMSSSIKEIAQSANQAAHVATSAVKMARDANANVSQLGEKQRRDRPGPEGHFLHQRTNQPPGLERHHRSGPGRRSR